MTDAKTTGEVVATDVLETLDALEHVDDSDAEWYDARAVDDVDEADDERLTFAAADRIPEGAPVEIKAACFRLEDGFGRYYIRQKQHERLVDERATYLLAVYDPDDDNELLGLLAAPALFVDALRQSWYHPDGRETYTQIRWSRFPFNGDLRQHTDYAGGD